MKDLSIAEAARLVGKDRKTLYRMMNGGKLSFKATEDGRRVIDPAELWRVFPFSAPSHGTETTPHNAPDATENRGGSGAHIEKSHVALLQEQLDAALAREKVALEREQAAMERERQAVEREAWLRERLAESERERLELSQRLLPPGKDATEEKQAEPSPCKSWWQRLFG